jgi:hypothetical protein
MDEERTDWRPTPHHVILTGTEDNERTNELTNAHQHDWRLRRFNIPQGGAASETDLAIMLGLDDQSTFSDPEFTFPVTLECSTCGQQAHGTYHPATRTAYATLLPKGSTIRPNF